jgi:1,4-alpha-glucan branching enzyme
MRTQPTATPHAYNLACHELDLSWEWDPATYGEGREGLRAYLQQEQPHLLRAYDIDFIVNAVESMKERLDRTR